MLKKGKLEEVIKEVTSKKAISKKSVTEQQTVEDETVEEETVEEETEAASSLHPAAKSITDPQALSTSKLGMMSGVMNAMNRMSASDQVNFFNQVMSQFGPGKSYGVDDNSDHNQSTLNMKPSAAVGRGEPHYKDYMPSLSKEEIEIMFNSKELSEEFTEKASVLFEAAVGARVALEVAKLEEEYVQQVTEELQIFTEELTDKLDSYIDYVVENWMSENEVAIESTLRNEITSEFINGLKNLMVEHNFDIPESKVDVVEALSNKIEVLEKDLDSVLTENNEYKEVLITVAKKEILEELSEGLALTQQEKFKTLAEGIEFDGDIETFEKKLKIIKETYFSDKTKVISSNIEEETFDTEEKQVVTNPAVNRYVESLSRLGKR